MEATEKFDVWGIVELFGHTQIAGKITEQNIAGTNMLRIDVPESDNNPAFTKFFGSGAIYAINPTTEEVARIRSVQLNVKPIDSWDIKRMMDKMTAIKQIESSLQSEIDDNPF